MDTPAHPEYPLTLWSAVSNSLAVTREAGERGLKLEAGRHPTLTALREALGLDLDLAPAWEPLRSIRLPDRTPKEAEIIEVMDGMYRGLGSSRKLTATATGSGLEVRSAGDSLAVREGDALILWVLFDNQTAEPVEFAAREFAARSGANEATVTVEAGRVRSALLTADPPIAGQDAAAIDLSAGDQTTTIALPLRVTPAWDLFLRLLDDETGEPVASRVYLTDEAGPVGPEGAVLRRDQHENAFFHADGVFAVHLSGEARVTIQRGMEYEPVELRLAAPAGGLLERDVRLRRWSDQRREGWYGGDVHVHLHYGGEYLLTPEHASLVQRGEDVHFMNMMVANSGSWYVNDEAWFEGRDNELSDAAHILRWGEEYRNNFYGHLCMYGIEELVPPIYSGFRLSDHPHDLPANAAAADHCHAVGGTLSYAHPMFGGIDLDRVFDHVRTVEAKELPVDVALGKVDALDVMSYPGVDLEVAELWYRLLNCGFRLPATAGTDTFMNFGGTGIFSNPPAGNRVFAAVEGEFTTTSWCEAVRAGRTFVTNGAMLRFTVDGEPAGSELSVRPGALLQVEAEARSWAPMKNLQLIVNGVVVADVLAEDGGRRASLGRQVQADNSCWIAVRALGDGHPLVFGGPLFAHTSPVYVRVGDAPVLDTDAAQYFVTWIDRLVAMCQSDGRYPDRASRDKVVALFMSARSVYEEMVRG